MAEKKEVVTWIEKHGETPAKAAGHFQNEGGWKVSAAQIATGGSRKNPSKCSCLQPRLLPCRHVFYLRKEIKK
ncbi:hypothetical protein PC116_g17875 [Phytophthora cactorum]|nr:hypothetical protein PC116_g17875 [Phytophthora cactorum]